LDKILSTWDLKKQIGSFDNKNSPGVGWGQLESLLKKKTIVNLVASYHHYEDVLTIFFKLFAGRKSNFQLK
jgi:hypothetical protein